VSYDHVGIAYPATVSLAVAIALLYSNVVFGLKSYQEREYNGRYVMNMKIGEETCDYLENN